MRRPIDIGGGVGYGQAFGADPATYRQFGMNGHNGFDYPSPVGRAIYAPEAGIITVSANGTRDQYTGNVVTGETIVIRGQRYEHWLLHLSSRLVGVGQQVNEGQLIGYSGNTGYTTGPHLHWGVRPLSPEVGNGYRGFIDPTLALEPVAPPPPPALPYNITPQAGNVQFVVRQGHKKWNLGHAAWENIVNNPLEEAGPGKVITVRATLKHQANLNYTYYLEDPNNPVGWNSADCDVYVPPAPVPEPPKVYVPPAAPVVPVKAELYSLVVPCMAFPTATDAGLHSGLAKALLPGEYYVWDKTDKARLLGKSNMKRPDPETWVNMADNVELPEPPLEPEPVVVPVIDVVPTPTHQAPFPDVILSPTSWKVTHSLRPDGKPVRMVSKNVLPMVLVDLEDKIDVKIDLPARKELNIVSWFEKPDRDGNPVRYAREERLIKGGWYYDLRMDMLEPATVAVPQAERPALDFNQDGKVTFDDAASLGGFINFESTRAYTKLRTIVKDLDIPKQIQAIRPKAARSIEGFRRARSEQIKRKDKVQ